MRGSAAGAGTGDAAGGTTTLTPLGCVGASDVASAGAADSVAEATEGAAELRCGHLRGDGRKGAKVLRRGASGAGAAASGAGLLALSAGADIRAVVRGGVRVGNGRTEMCWGHTRTHTRTRSRH